MATELVNKVCNICKFRSWCDFEESRGIDQKKECKYLKAILALIAADRAGLVSVLHSAKEQIQFLEGNRKSHSLAPTESSKMVLAKIDSALKEIGK